MVDSQDSSQRRKIALIPVLGILLIGAVFWPANEENTSSGENSSTNSDSAQPEAATNGSNAVETGTEAIRSPKVWPRIALAEILSFDPFSLPKSFSSQLDADESASEVDPNQQAAVAETIATPDETDELERLDQLKESLEQHTVSVIYYSEQGAVALINSKLVREGDLLVDGVRVLKIGPKGVIVEFEAP